jgi:3-hydroxybutyrate dehydrogenase
MLQGKRALVTGSTSGIGYAIATALAEQGCRVMLHGLGDPAVVAERRRQLAARTGQEILLSEADLTRPERITAMMAEVQTQWGGVDILVNNAGIQHVSPLEQFAPERWDAVLAVNLSAAFHTTRLALPAMRAAGWGRIVNLASAHGLVASVNKAAYVAAKHGLVGLTKVTALETAGSGITCNAICPGWVRTELVEPQIAAVARRDGVDLEEGGRRLLAEKQPSRQFVQAEQLGAFVVFLCSPAATQLTGAALSMDGGWTAQ